MARGWRESRILRLALGVLVALLLAEGLARLLFPRMAELASPRFAEHAYRIHSNPRSARYEMVRPDTGEAHPVIHNERGFRQHRPIGIEKPAGTTRIGVFGDSFTENLRIEAPYSLIRGTAL